MLRRSARGHSASFFQARRQIVLGAVILGLVAVAPVGAAETAIDRLERLGRALRQHEVWQSEYRQEYVAAGMTFGEEAQGTVWIAWPDRAHFREASSGGAEGVRWLGMEGRVFRLVDLEVPSCDDHALDDEDWARVPLAAVLDPRGAVQSFSILDHGSDGVMLKPRDPGGIDRVEVKLDPTGLPAEVAVIDVQGAVNRLWFEGWSSGNGPPEGRWLPAPPDGLVCVETVS